MAFLKTVGSKREVWNGTAKHTAGKLTKKDLVKSKGRIKSKRKVKQGKKSIKLSRKLGFVAKKGTFKLFRKK